MKIPMHFTVIHLSGTYILQKVKKIMNQTLISYSVTQILIGFCIFESHSDCCTPCLTGKFESCYQYLFDS